MMHPVFEAKTHESYLKARLNAADAPRGVKARLAEFMRVQPAYLSQVLAGKYSLSLEQADLANQFFDHSNDESEYFLLLVSRDRASTPTLRSHFERQIAELRARRMQVVQRLGKKFELTNEAKGIYYSSWIYAAIHVACTIPSLQTRKSLAAHFSFSPQTVETVLEFLESNGLLRKDGDRYLTTQNWVRLDKKSPHIVKLHSNWRQKAVQNLDEQSEEDLHYSGVFSMDRATMNSLKDQILSLIQKELKNVEKAKEEELVALGIDLFSI